MDYKQAQTIVDIALKMVPQEVIELLATTITEANTEDEVCDMALEYVNVQFGGAIQNMVEDVRLKQLGLPTNAERHAAYLAKQQLTA